MKYELTSDKDLYEVIDQIGVDPSEKNEVMSTPFFTEGADFLYGFQPSSTYIGEQIEAEFYWEEGEIQASVKGNLEEASGEDQKVAEILQ